MSLVKFRTHNTPAFDARWNNFFANSFAPFGRDENFSVPAVNIAEAEGGYRIDVAAPGLKKENFSISIENDMLTISAKVETTGEEKAEKYTRKEFGYNSFTRTFSLPQEVDAEAINATYIDGVLAVSVPKKEEAKAKQPRVVTVA